MIWLALTVSAVAVIGVVVRWYATRLHQNLVKMERHRNGYFEAAEKLIADERTPATVAVFVIQLSRGLTNRVLPYVLYFLPWLPAPAKVRVEVDHLWEALDQLPTDLKRDFFSLRYHGLLVIALQSALIGDLLLKRIDHPSHDTDDGAQDGGARLRSSLHLL